MPSINRSSGMSSAYSGGHQRSINDWKVVYEPLTVGDIWSKRGYQEDRWTTADAPRRRGRAGLPATDCRGGEARRAVAGGSARAVGARARLQRVNVPARGVIATARVGRVADEIVCLAEKHGVSEIVTGLSRRSWLARLLGGSVGRQILQRSPIPVIAIPSPAVERPTGIGSALIPRQRRRNGNLDQPRSGSRQDGPGPSRACGVVAG